ncbi:hypothetical protein BDU57DRAFT_437529, partial [Ampelomyces quisqualis]
VPTNGLCIILAPILSGRTHSGLLDQRCEITVLLYSDHTFTSMNVMTYDVMARCVTVGPRMFIRSARTVGTCA